MAIVSRGLPERPHIDVPKREARELLKGWKEKQPAALDRIRQRHPKFRWADAASIASASFRLSDAHLVIAREYGFSHWTDLKQRIDANSLAQAIDRAIRDDDRDTVVRVLGANPQLLHVPVCSPNWGPPMSHAANLGRLEIIQTVAKLGARDFQHAFDRAVLQGRIDCARWLHEHGARLVPGCVMGPCETLNARGLRFLSEVDAPFTNAEGDRVAPLALVLETYTRNPVGKHEVLSIFAERGFVFPDTPMMAFHRGDLKGLREHFRRDPALLHRRFSLREIYPADCGCKADGQAGMHWTPIDGTTLLHLAIDFRERQIFDWLLGQGADANARALVDRDGFGGHTPLFNALVHGPGDDARTVQALLLHGADSETRASLRKFLDWCERPRWHEVRDVTAAEWASTFPDAGWVNESGMRILAAPS